MTSLNDIRFTLAIAQFFEKIGYRSKKVKNSLIIGGGTIAHYLALDLLKIGFRVRIIEQKKERCDYLSEMLPPQKFHTSLGEGVNFDV